MERVDSQVKLPEVAVWNVVFMSGERECWWDWLTDPAYRHVCAFGWDPLNDSWIIMDPRRSHLQVMPVDDAGLGVWLAQNRSRITEIREAKVAGDADPRGAPPIGLWCTGVVKRLIGSNSGAFRPQALRDDLVRRSAPRVFDEPSPESPPGRPGNESAP